MYLFTKMARKGHNLGKHGSHTVSEKWLKLV